MNWEVRVQGIPVFRYAAALKHEKTMGYAAAQSVWSSEYRCWLRVTGGLFSGEVTRRLDVRQQ